jgi:hypothetical protein
MEKSSLVAIPFGGEYGACEFTSPQFAKRVFLGPETKSLELNLDAHVGGDENTLRVMEYLYTI